MAGGALFSTQDIVRGYMRRGRVFREAVQPMVPEDPFQQACASLDVDLITISLTQRLPFKMRLPAIKTAIARGIYFEINYAGALRDVISRRQVFSNAQALTRILRGKNIILSSGSRHAYEIRGPMDLIFGLGSMFGLTESQARDAISTNCLAVVEHGAARQMYAGTIAIMPSVPSGARAEGETDQKARGAKADLPGGSAVTTKTREGADKRKR
eukprot:gene19294-25941_t